MASSRDYERRQQSVTSLASVPGYIEEDTVLPPETSTNQRIQERTNNTISDIQYYRDLAKRYKDQRDEARRQALAFEQELAYAKDELTRAETRIGELQDEIAASISTANWRPRGIDPADPLTGEIVEDYGPWRYAIDEKLGTDAPLYPTDRTKVRYALAMMKNPIFSAMQNWVADTGRVTFDDLMEEVEHYMGFHLQQRQAKKDLQTIKQEQGENISQYYHRIRILWQKAKTPEGDRVDQLLTTILPGLSAPLLSKSYVRLRDLLDDARIIEDRKKDISYNHPRQWRGQAPRDTTSHYDPKVKQPTSKTNAKTSERETLKNLSSFPDSFLHRNLTPTAMKPERWIGRWYNAENNPKRLTDELKTQLQREARCWACRGSGHRAQDSVCPQRGWKIGRISSKEALESSESEHNSENV